MEYKKKLRQEEFLTQGETKKILFYSFDDCESSDELFLKFSTQLNEKCDYI